MMNERTRIGGLPMALSFSNIDRQYKKPLVKIACVVTIPPSLVSRGDISIMVDFLLSPHRGSG